MHLKSHFQMAEDCLTPLLCWL